MTWVTLNWSLVAVVSICPAKSMRDYSTTKYHGAPGEPIAKPAG